MSQTEKCGSKVAWPVHDEHWATASCVLPLGHVGERQHVGFVRGFARGQHQAIDVRVEWTRPEDPS